MESGKGHYYIIAVYLCELNRARRLATDPVVMRSGPATDIYAVHCWLISPNKL